MKTLLTANISTKIASSGGSAWEPPVFTYGEDFTIALRFAQNLDGLTVEPALDITGLTASLGPEDARPESGTFAIQVGSGAQTSGNTTAALQHDCKASEMEAAINAKSAVVTAYGAATVRKADGSWIITFATAVAAVPMQVRDNTLFPVSLGRVSAEAIDGVWHHELRLVQTPCAFTDASERILPPPPTVTRLRAGASGGGYSYNELQRLYVPPDFRATYSLKSGFERTGQLSVSDTAETIQAALEAIFDAGNVIVTNPAPYTADIEFTGDLKGTTVDVIEVLPFHPPLGDLTFTLSLDRASLLARLRRERAVTLPLEVRLTVENDEEVEEKIVAFRTDITVQRPIFYDELATTPDVDWLRPPSPIDYVPRSAGAIFTGTKSQAFVRGNGSATVFALAHSLATEDIRAFGRLNTSGGRQLIHGTDFTAIIDNANQVTVTSLIGAPATNAWALYLEAVEPVAAFAGHTHTIGEITDLEDRLTALEESVSDLQDLAPVTPLGTASAAASVKLTIALDDRSEVFPGAGTPALPPRPRGGLLPAVHDATVTSVTTVLPDAAANAGNVISNGTAGALTIPPGLYFRETSIAVGEFAASDGRRWYPVTRAGATNSYFPRDFERTLFAFEVNAQMLRAGTSLALDFSLALQLLNATCRGVYVVVVEHGIAASQTSPSTTSPNLSAINWNATPLLSQRVIVTENKVSHRFGIDIIRAAGGSLSANKRLYGFATAADSIPADPNVAIRARLVNFDTENSDLNARGAVSYALTEAAAIIS